MTNSKLGHNYDKQLECWEEPTEPSTALNNALSSFSTRPAYISCTAKVQLRARKYEHILSDICWADSTRLELVVVEAAQQQVQPFRGLTV